MLFISCPISSVSAPTKLYELLIHNQGREIVIPVLRNKEEILVRVMVPELEVPLKNVSFLF